MFLMEERETLYNYDIQNDCWYVYSNHRPHITQILERAEITRKDKNDEGRIIAVEGKVEANQVRLFKELK